VRLESNKKTLLDHSIDQIKKALSIVVHCLQYMKCFSVKIVVLLEIFDQ